MPKIVIRLFFYLIPCFIYAQCPVGDVRLINQNDVDNYISSFGTCEVINGSLIIMGDSAIDISGITAIKRIEGSLIIDSKMTSIANFSNLEFVGGNFKIDHNDVIETIEGINKLHTVNGDFLITQNYTSLKTITGFNSLEKIGGNFQISENHSLEMIAAFDNLITVGGWFLIRRADKMQRLNGFNKLMKIGAGHDASSMTGALTIVDNHALIGIDGFNALIEMGLEMQVTNNRNLLRVKGFTNLQKVGSLIFRANSLLVEIPIFNSLMTISGRLEISNSKLVDIVGFNNLQSLDWYLNFSQNSELVIITGFANLNKINGQFSITSNPVLKSLIGFKNLVETSGINIAYNVSIENLKGLENLFTVGVIGGTGVSIRWNDSLSDCTAICNLLSNGTVSGEIYIANNPSACSSEQEVRAECSPAGGDGRLAICLTSSPVDLFDSLTGAPDLGGVWTPVLLSGNGLFNPLVDHAGVYTYTITTGVGTSESSEVTVTIDNVPNAGGDENLTVCSNITSVDLFESLLGTPDKGGVWKPNLTDGNGLFNPAFDAAGIYTYTVTNSCGTATSKITVAVDVFPDAGENGSLDICIADNSVDLFNRLMGTPDIGGIWTPQLASGTGVFDPSKDRAGIYTYTLSGGVCGSVTSEVSVAVNTLPNAGQNGTLDLCMNSSSVNLFDSLGGSPDMGGVWSPTLSSGTGVFNPSVDASGVYFYTVTNGVCGTSAAKVNVLVDALSNAGEDGRLEICRNGNSVDLFAILSGTPDTGGVWSPSLSSGTGVFDPKIDTGGAYTYAVANGCGVVISKVMVDVINFTPISDYDIKIKEFSGNNSLEIIVNSNADYQYSLDGLQYQNSPIFDHLSGGDYTIYVREINGCGILQEAVTILDFPKFFTPNNDGFHDVWTLKGSTTRVYDLYIHDRYGKLLKQIRTSGKADWDGTYRGENLPSDDYWFKVVFEDGVVKSGHFSLKR
ncbi:T9SS type B sorting domain-containing protein [Gelidibacter maritimus]|uniref:T9SS type B sorting domain-containing protein n=1 Tax=Gelidibacter maritimus TaxID=2761487 RepID=A0A7W2M8W7_9FLAO|nr:T9SS type B sorting domain-containing protein [Gelidibacter maritimus]MBA6154757.1 T9SS type B sorting domain-containing protein [Gelidibacter maritimus]